MKLIIDIPKEAYNRLLTEQHLPNRLDIEWCITHGTPIPDDATNDDVLQIVFGECGHRSIQDRVFQWLFAPYQKGGKSEN